MEIRQSVWDYVLRPAEMFSRVGPDAYIQRMDGPAVWRQIYTVYPSSVESYASNNEMIAIQNIRLVSRTLRAEINQYFFCTRDFYFWSPIRLTKIFEADWASSLRDFTVSIYTWRGNKDSDWIEAFHYVPPSLRSVMFKLGSVSRKPFHR